MTADAPRAGTEPDPGTEPDDSYLERLLLLHPECDPGPFEEAPRAVPAAARVASPTVPAPSVPSVPTAARVLVGVGGPSSPAIAYDGDGWITVVPDEPVSDPLSDPLPEARPAAPATATSVSVPDLPFHTVTSSDEARPRWRRNIPYVAVVLIISVVIAAMALAPGGERPVLLSGVPSTGAGDGADPLAQTWRLDKLNLQFSQVEKGYVQVFDGSIDPVGTDGCTQPGKEDGVVASSRAAYAYRPDHLDGFAAGHVATMITVFDDEQAAERRADVERRPAYLECLSDWDEATWFGGGEVRPESQSIVAVPASLGDRTLIGARYTATYDAPDGRSYAAYTDHLVVTTGRVRVWIELSSVLYPFDPEQRDVVVDGILERIDDALT